MPTPRAPSIVLTTEQRAAFERIERAATSEQREALRTRIILRAAESVANGEIAEELNITRKTASKWRARFALLGEKGLDDAPRSGRPSVADPVVRCQVIAIACSLAKQVEDS